MIPVSGNWVKAAFGYRENAVRNPMYARVELGEFDPTARADAVITIPPGTAISAGDLDTAQACSYASYEGDAIPVNGAQIFLPDAVSERQTQGWISMDASGADGTFASPVTVHVTFGEKHRMAGVTMQFDDIADLYPDRFTITTYLDGAQVALHAVENDGPRFDTGLALDWFDEMTIAFTRTVRPYQRIHLQTLEFGIGYRFENDDIIEVEFVRSADPLCLELPESKLMLKVYNRVGMFDADAKTPVAEFFQEDQKATLSVGLDVDGHGTVEWIRLCTLWLDSWETNGIEASFGFVDGLARLRDMDAYEAEDTGERMLLTSLQTMLSSVGFTAYRFSDYVENMQITNDFPKTNPAEILQLAANLCMSQLHTASDGVLRLYSAQLGSVASNLPSYNGATEIWSRTPYYWISHDGHAYAAYDEDLITVDGGLLFCPEEDEARVDTGAEWKGYPADGAYAGDPGLTIVFAANVTFSACRFRFPGSNLPSGIRIQCWHWDETNAVYEAVSDKTYVPTGRQTAIYDDFFSIKKVVVTFTGNAKRQKLRLLNWYMFNGCCYEFRAEDIFDRATGVLNRCCKDLIIDYHTDGEDTQTVESVNDYGEDVEINNDLLATTNILWMDSSHSGRYINLEEIYAGWTKKSLGEFRDFEFETPGFPEVDAGDRLLYKGEWATVLRHEFTFSGGAARSRFTIQKG